MWEIERISHTENTENTPCSTILYLSETYEYTDILIAFANYLSQIYNERKLSLLIAPDFFTTLFTEDTLKDWLTTEQQIFLLGKWNTAL